MNISSEEGRIADIYESMLNGDKSALSKLQQIDNKFSPRKSSQPQLIADSHEKQQSPAKPSKDLSRARQS